MQISTISHAWRQGFPCRHWAPCRMALNAGPASTALSAMRHGERISKTDSAQTTMPIRHFESVVGPMDAHIVQHAVLMEIQRILISWHPEIFQIWSPMFQKSIIPSYGLPLLPIYFWNHLVTLFFMLNPLLTLKMAISMQKTHANTTKSFKFAQKPMKILFPTHVVQEVVKQCGFQHKLFRKQCKI